ncbi:MAG TPA: acyltransferase [Acidimicrobiia bacterium]|nr:acyltransferase [Acidimicrobiia bacterium]
MTAVIARTKVAIDDRSPSDRDGYADVLRAFSLLIVVLWHWVFTVVQWRPDGPHASNPIGTTHGLWLLTWLLQVMPLFFFVGGFAHLATWRSVAANGGGYATFVRRRLGRLGGPTLITLAVVGVVRLGVEIVAPGVGWAGRGLLLIISPLWFLGVYVVLVLITPLMIKTHDAIGEVALVLLAGAAMWVDLGRFRYDIDGIAWVNMIVVWALVHQVGFFWERLREAPARAHWTIAIGGLFALTGFTNMGLYPRSMVGVPGEQISNMAPPTLTIVALGLLQVGLIGLARPIVMRWVERERPARWVAAANRLSMTIFLWHLTGYAIAYGALRLVGLDAPEATTGEWWLQRPLWLVAPALATMPVVSVFHGFESRRRGRRG